MTKKALATARRVYVRLCTRMIVQSWQFIALSSAIGDGGRRSRRRTSAKHSPRTHRSRSHREIECLLNDNHQKGKMMIMIMKTSGSQVDSPVVEGNRTEGGGRKIRDLHRDT